MEYYITTPIYYVNGEPHLGHAYTTIAADVLARYHRQKGDDVFFLTGVDEHGNKVAQAAAERGLTPRQHVDQLAPRFKDLTRQLNATNDFFIRTTDPEHEAFVQGFVERMKAAGDIEKRSYGGLYCTACEGFWYERDLAPDGTCPDHGIKPVWLEEENYYFLLSKYQDRLAEIFRADPDFVKPRSRYNEALSFIEQGLDDISISRSSITWGVPVPWDEEQVIYVWVDALINYLSALTYARPGEDLTERYWPVVHHLLAKDILKFHAVDLAGPASQRRPLPARGRVHPRLPAHGWREDEQDARQRARPVRGDGAVRHRPAALLPHARGHARSGRGHQPRGLRGALQQRAGQRASAIS